MVLFHCGLRNRAWTSLSTSACPALRSLGGWSSFEPSGPKLTSMKLGSIQETEGSFAGGGILQKAAWAERLLAVEVGGQVEMPECVELIDEPEHRHVVVRVPAPGDVGVVEVA